MNIKQIFSSILVIASTTVMIGSVSAATYTENLRVYAFEKGVTPTLDSSEKLMKQFLNIKSIRNIKIDDAKIARFVSDKDVNTTFEQDFKTGNLRFQRNFSRYLGDFKPHLPSPDESVKITYNFLKMNKLLPRNESELKLAHVGGLRASTVTDKNEAGPVIDKLVTLSYSREVNGIPVIGPGSKFVVNIGHKGEIIGLIRQWRELKGKGERLAPNELYSEKEALRLAEKQIATEFGNKAQFEVIQSQIAYFDNNGSFLQPVFAFQTKVMIDDKNIQPLDYICVIQAMKKPKQDLKLTAVDDRALTLIKDQNLYGTIPEENSKYSD